MTGYSAGHTGIIPFRRTFLRLFTSLQFLDLFPALRTLVDKLIAPVTYGSRGHRGRCLTIITLLPSGVQAGDEILRYEDSGTGEVPGRDKGFQIAGAVHDIAYGYPVIPPAGRETRLRDPMGRLAGVASSSAGWVNRRSCRWRGAMSKSQRWSWMRGGGD